MKKVVATSLALSLLLGVGAVSTSLSEPITAEASGYAYSQDQQEALKYLNSIRAKVGVQQLQLEPYLTKAATNHVKYINMHGTSVGHTETKGRAGFTGVNPWDRVESVGGSNLLGTSEVLSYSETNVKDSIDILMNAPYHRSLILSYSQKYVGVYIDSQTFGANLGTKEDTNSLEYVYPHNGQTDVPVSFDGFENPNPLTQFGIETSGYVISYASTQGFDEFKATLKDSKGNIVPIFTENAGELFLFPKSHLKYNEKYTVSVSYTTWAGEPVAGKTWSFTTEKDPKVTSPKPTNPNPPLTGVGSKYSDFNPKADWAKPMEWVIGKGLLSGYTVNNKGKTEYLLKPTVALTESQFVTILYRYKEPARLSKSTQYTLPAQDKLPIVKGGAYKPITRGKMAQILATKHFGKPVSEKVAVQFMYDSGMSDGYLVNGKNPKTYDSYGAENNLQRAHIAKFFQNYDTYLLNQGKK